MSGTTAYSPASGTVVSAGASQALQVTFTPTDTVDYTTATATVSIDCQPGDADYHVGNAGGHHLWHSLERDAVECDGIGVGNDGLQPALGTVLSAGGSQALQITFTPTDTVDYTTATATVSIDVNQATPTITWATPEATTYGTALSATQLNATGSVSGTMAYSPASGTVLSAAAARHCRLPLPRRTQWTTRRQQPRCLSHVNQATPTITWATPEAITYGTALSATQLNATGSVSGTTAYSPASGTVLDAGGSQALQITFTPTDTVDYATATATVSIDINQATPTITWATPEAITYGTILSATQLNATGSVLGTMAYSLASGTVLAAGASQALQVTFTPTDTVDYTTAISHGVYRYQPGDADYHVGNPGGHHLWHSLERDAVKCDRIGVGNDGLQPGFGDGAHAGGSQALQVTFTPTDTVDYTTATATVSININQATPTITWATPAAITYGTALSTTQLNATGSVSGTTTYSPASGTVLSAGGSQALQITFTPTDTVDYTTATATASIDINQATPTITWATPEAITYGTALSATQLNATGSVSGTTAYSLASGTVLIAGASQALQVTFTPTDTVDYTTATATVSIDIDQATPTITWATPEAITYGMALSATQLNATGSVSGTTAYNPVSGTVLIAGASQTLQVTFTPTDTVDYAMATDTVSINVNKAGTVTVLSSSPNLPVLGQAVTFTATVSAMTSDSATPTGVVTFTDNGSSIGTASLDSSSVATLTTSSLAKGSLAMSAVYGGDANYLSSAPGMLHQLVLANTLQVISFTPTSTGFVAVFNRPLDVGTASARC